MKTQSEFTKFAFGLGIAFGLPWLLLVVVPYVKLSAIEPEAYTEADGVEGLVAYPAKPVGGSIATGERLYDSLGCAYCHTQMVRPTYAGADMWRGWGGGKDGAFARETQPADYWGETHAMLGYQRIGPDLSNVGWRRTDRDWLLQHLYSPRSLNRESVMPGYESLFNVRKFNGQQSDSALKLEGKYAPEQGYEVVPTAAAEALVDYLLSRKKDAPIPGSGRSAAEESEAPASE